MLVLVVVGVQAVIVIVIRSVAVECRENDESAHPERTIAHTSVHTPNEHTRAAAGARREWRRPCSVPVGGFVGGRGVRRRSVCAVGVPRQPSKPTLWYWRQRRRQAVARAVSESSPAPRLHRRRRITRHAARAPDRLTATADNRYHPPLPTFYTSPPKNKTKKKFPSLYRQL